MTKRQTAQKASSVFFVLGLCVAMLSVSACAPTQMSAQQKEQLIQKLETARARDEQVAAADSAANPAEAQDAMVQAYKADRRIRDLENGFSVSQLKIEHSLEVPPRSLSAGQKAVLIEKLQHARRLDERGEEYSAQDDDQVAQDAYDEHEAKVDRVIKDLEIGEDVPWSRIEGALQPPENP
jgi:hypothetical protein